MPATVVAIFFTTRGFMYRRMDLKVVVADDSNLEQVIFERSATIWKTLDLESVSPTLRVAPADGDTQVSLGAVTSGKFVALFSDYPIRFRINGAGATQFIMSSANVPATNVGAPLPAQCAFAGNLDVTSVYVQPIASAAQTANVWIVVCGDPTNNYT